MKILITGAFGFVGASLSATLTSTNKHRLIAVDLIEPEHHYYSEFITWDELQNLNGRNINSIIHLAGKAHDTKNQSKAEEYFDINTGLTQKVFDYFLHSDARKFIFFSSVKAAADVVHGEFLTEDVVPQPKGPYGESKIKAEEYILSKQEEYEAKGKQVYILRPCMIHGPGNKGNLNLLFNVVSKGIPWPLGAYENKRSFCSVDNISYVVGQLVSRENIPDGIYHIGDDEALSTNDIIRLISQSVNKKPRIWNLPKEMINAMAGIGEALHLPLTRERLNKLTENYVVSNAKIKNALGIETMPVSARQGMIKTLESFKYNNTV
jgi:nucleoside-diphosphate-sugar epimerase